MLPVTVTVTGRLRFLPAMFYSSDLSRFRELSAGLCFIDRALGWGGVVTTGGGSAPLRWDVIVWYSLFELIDYIS